MQLVSQDLDYLIIKTKGRVTLPSVSISIIEVKIPELTNTIDLYEMNADTFQLPEGVILLDVLHRVDHKTPQHLNVAVLNANYVPCSIGKNMPIASMPSVAKCEEFRRLAGAVSSATPPNCYHKYHKIPIYNWNQILKV